MKELKYRKEAKQFIEDRGFSGIANQTEVEALMSAFAHKIVSNSALLDVILCLKKEQDKSEGMAIIYEEKGNKKTAHYYRGASMDYGVSKNIINNKFVK